MFDRLSKLNYVPTNVLDIGANVGQWSTECKKIWPSSNFYLIEACPIHEQKLKLLPFDYKIVLLNKFDGKTTFFQTKTDLGSTGNSIYKENTPMYNDENLVSTERDCFMMDTLFPDGDFDFIKLDTQGSELDILRGGKQLIKNTKFVLIETSICEYNIGAPTMSDVIIFMKNLEFEVYDICEMTYKDNKLFQIDILFKKNEL